MKIATARICLILLAAMGAAAVVGCNGGPREAWVEPREEITYQAESDARIASLNVRDGQIITQSDIDNAIAAGEPGFLLYTMVSDSGSVGEGEIEKQQSIIAQRKADMALVKSGADMGYTADNKIARDLRDAEEKLADKTADEESTKAKYDLADEEFKRAEKNYANRLITIDAFENAKTRKKNAGAAYDAAKEIRKRAEDRYNVCKQTADKALAKAPSPITRKEAIAKCEAKLKEAQAELTRLESQQDIRSYYTKTPGRVCELKVEKGARVSGGNRILTIVPTE